MTRMHCLMRRETFRGPARQTLFFIIGFHTGAVTKLPFRWVLFVESTDLLQAMSFSTAFCKVFSAANACIYCENGPTKDNENGIAKVGYCFRVVVYNF